MDFLAAGRALRSAAKILEENYDEEFLVRVLGFYPNYFTVEQANFHLEIFVELYLRKQAEFERAIDKALSKRDAATFRIRMGYVIGEYFHGNG